MKTQRKQFDGTNKFKSQTAQMIDLMKDGLWRTPEQITSKTKMEWGSASSILRILRGKKYGYKVEKRYLSYGIYQYRVKTGP